MGTGTEHKTVPVRRNKGPHDLGDPNDTFLRKVEMEVVIPQKMRNKAREEKCVEEVNEFVKCCTSASYLMGFKCRDQNSTLKKCLTKWYTDETFKEECKQEYLEERRYYRANGVPLKSQTKRLT